MFKKHWQLSLTIAFISLGFLLSLQFRTHIALQNDLNSQNSDTLAAIAKNLTTKYYELIREVWDSRSQLRLLEQNENQSKTVREAVKREKQKLNIALGTVPVEGPGLVITIPDNGQNYFGYQDLIDIINELWNAGAEAVSVNGHRINDMTAISSTEDFSAIFINDEKLSYPYVIQAAGEPDTLEKGISIPSGIIDNLRSVFKIPMEIEQKDHLKLPSAKLTKFYYSEPVIDKKSAN